MILGLLTLLTALCISGIAAYYSIVGLTAIFAAAVIPIVIMGAVLELGKVVTTLWLHYNWERANWKIRTYLVGAVAVLMFITSMGIFGFLSKAHLEQSVPSGDIMAQVSLFDEKIKTQRDNIESSRKALTQMDSAVDQTLSRSNDENGATKSANLRRSQSKERARLQQDIDAAQKEITKLQEQRAPIASQFRKVEAEVGPIKYIAALIYGDKADQNMLEAAVRWVIIIIVFVFDPLAIILILAATTSIDWSKVDRVRRRHEKNEQAKTEALEKSELDELNSSLELKRTAEINERIQDAIDETRAQCEAEFEAEKLAECENCAEQAEINLATIKNELAEKSDQQILREQELAQITDYLGTVDNQIYELTSSINLMEETCSSTLAREESVRNDLTTIIQEYDSLVEEKHKIEEQLHKEISKNELSAGSHAVTIKELEEIKEAFNIVATEALQLKEQLESTKNQHIVVVGQEPLGAEFADVLQENLWDLYETEPEIEPEVEVLVEEPVVVEVPVTQVEEIVEPTPIVELEADVVHTPITTVNVPQIPTKVTMPAFKAMPDTFPMGGNASFGTSFPTTPPIKGDLFLRVDYVPSKLFKWVGERWIEIDKSSHDNYVFDEEYIKLLVNKVSLGEYDIDDLNETEQEQVAAYLQRAN